MMFLATSFNAQAKTIYLNTGGTALWETAGSGYYEATVTGKYGEVILYLGTSATKAAPDGFFTASKGEGYAMYYTTTHPIVDKGLEEVTEMVPALDWSEPVYNLLGQPVDADYKGVVIQNGKKMILR